MSTAAIAKSEGGISGTIKKGGTYYVYANVSGSGTPPAGLGSLSADVSAITTRQSAAALSAGSYTVDGQDYNYRTAQLTAKSTLAAGMSSFAVKLTDSAGTATTNELLGHRRQHPAAHHQHPDRECLGRHRRPAGAG